MFLKNVFIFICFITVSFVFFTNLNAQDRVFGRTYLSNTLGKNQRDLEIWTTYHTGRSYLFHQVDHNVEYEVGIADNFQTAFYLNYSQKYSAEDGGNSNLESPKISFAQEFKYKLSDNVADAFGSALYAEYTIAPNEVELELKFILDKKIGNNIFAFNATVEPEFETSSKNNITSTNIETNFEFNIAYMYLLNKNLGLGIELRNHNLYAEGNYEHSALFFGPTITYFADNWWVVLNALPQIAKIKDYLPEDKASSLILSELEKVEYRIIFSFNM